MFRRPIIPQAPPPLLKAAALVFALAALALLGGCAGTRDNITDFNTVVIDAGHGGHDTGAFTRNYSTRRVRVGGRMRTQVFNVGPRYLEKNLTLDVAQRIEPKLKAAGFRTVMTRRSDVFIPLDERVRIGNARRKSVFLSVHFNDARRRYSSGVEVFHNRVGTWQLAERIEHSLAAMPGGVGRGVKTANFRVLRGATGPSLLVECGFLSNATEAARCASPAWREETARRIAGAVIAQRQQGPFRARRVPKETPADAAPDSSSSTVGSTTADAAASASATGSAMAGNTTTGSAITSGMVVVSSTTVVTTLATPAAATTATKPAKGAKPAKGLQAAGTSPTAGTAAGAAATAATPPATAPTTEQPVKKRWWSFFRKRSAESDEASDGAAAPAKKPAETETVTPVLPGSTPGATTRATGNAAPASTAAASSPKKTAGKAPKRTKKKAAGKTGKAGKAGKTGSRKKGSKKAAHSAQE